MKKKLFVYLLFIFFSFCFVANSVDAGITSKTSYIYNGYQRQWVIWDDSTSKVYFCIKKGKTLNYKCGFDSYSFSSNNEKLRAAIGTAIKWYNDNKGSADVHPEFYYGVQQVIHKILYMKAGGQNITGNLEFQNLNFNHNYNVAMDVYNAYGSESLTKSGDFTFYKSESNYVATTTITRKYLNGLNKNNMTIKLYATNNSGTKTLIKEFKGTEKNNVISITAKSGSSDLVKISIPVTTIENLQKNNLENYNNKKLTIELGATASSNRYYYLANFYSCGSGYQELASMTLTPHGHNTKSVTVSGSIAAPVDPPNKQLTCEEWLQKNSGRTSPITLLAVYKTYGYTNLLNFDNPSCTNAVCDTWPESGCLSASLGNNNFSSSNFSCVMDSPSGHFITNASGAFIGACDYTYNLKNSIGTNNFYAITGEKLIWTFGNEYGVEYYNERYGKNSRTNGALAAIATLQKKCYIYKGNSYDINLDRNIEVYFGDNDADGSADLLDYTDTENETKNPAASSNYFDEYIVTKTRNFYFNDIYLEKMTGKYVDSDTVDDIASNPSYSYVGKGILSGFVLNNKDHIPLTIQFMVTSPNKNLRWWGVTSDDCKVSTIEKLITTTPGGKGELELEFRTIDTNNPFNRDAHTNWCFDGVACAKDNYMVETYILNRANSYGKKKGTTEQQTPLYKITLNANDIKIIRNYNKENKYDDYRLYCDSKGCQNAFLRSLKYSTVRKYKLNNANLEKVYGSLSSGLKINKS